MSGEDLKKLFQEAAEIAKAVPKELREAAFNRALDALSVPSSKKPQHSTRPSAAPSTRSGSATRRRTRKKAPKSANAKKKAAKFKTSKEKSGKSKASSKKAAAAKKGSKSRRPGPGAMLRDLAAAGFFSEPRTISDIQGHAQHNLAHAYGLNELSTPLRRAIHNNLLVRTQNTDGQYEYTAV